MKCEIHGENCAPIFVGPPHERRWFCSICLHILLVTLGLKPIKVEKL